MPCTIVPNMVKSGELLKTSVKFLRFHANFISMSVSHWRFLVFLSCTGLPSYDHFNNHSGDVLAIYNSVSQASVSY